MTRSGPSRRAKILTAILSPLLVFGLAEIVLRVAGFAYDPTADFDREGSYDELAEDDLYERDSTLLWRLRRSTTLDNEEAGFENVSTNAAGLRGPELPTKTNGDELRVLCLGDSITFGLGLSGEGTWPERAAEALRRAPELAGRTVRVINVAVPGWSSVQGMRALEELSDLKPDIIVFWFGINDAKPARDFPDSAQRMPGKRSRQALAALRHSRVFQLVQSAVTGARRATVAAERVSEDEFQAHIETLLERERNGGPAVIFVRTPERIEVTADQLERVVARARAEGVEMLAGPSLLFTTVLPAPPGTDLTGTRFDAPDGSALIFEREQADEVRSVADVEADLRMLRNWKRALDLRLVCLPASSLDGAALLGDAAPEDFFSDNCHLSDAGARSAGTAIADEILRRIK